LNYRNFNKPFLFNIQSRDLEPSRPRRDLKPSRPRLAKMGLETETRKKWVSRPRSSLETPPLLNIWLSLCSLQRCSQDQNFEPETWLKLRDFIKKFETETTDLNI